jgi:starch phosphorylase
LGGHTDQDREPDGRARVRWTPERVVKGTPYDTPISGYRVNTCNTLRLWKAEAAESFDFQAFNVGDYYGAVDEKVASENLTKVLYPNDEPVAGKRLRLEQQYFFVSCSLQNIIDIHLQAGGHLEDLHKLWAVQLNDTHPAVAVAELMRLLVDEHLMEWDLAWHITVETCGYTNHTLLPEALEKWPLPLFARVLPRHLEIIYEINRRFLDSVERHYPGDNDRLSRMSLIDESGEKYVRMANLACVGSHAINGVAALHTELVKQDVLRDFFEMMPEKFSNKTNGVTPRRFMVLSNPGLSDLIWEAHQPVKDVNTVLPQEIQYRIRMRDGEIRWIEHAHQSVYDPDGEFLGIRASNRDITKYKIKPQIPQTIILQEISAKAEPRWRYQPAAVVFPKIP